MRRAIGLVLALVVATVLGQSLAVAAVVPPTLTYYVAPDGSDANDGLSAETPLATIAAAHALLCARNGCDGIHRPVDIVLLPGVHLVANVAWRYFDDTYPTRFIAAEALGAPAPSVGAETLTDPVSGTVYALPAQLPLLQSTVLDGRGSATYGIAVTIARPSATERTNLQFIGLYWRNYVREALLIKGNSAGEHGNLILGNTFQDIGNEELPTNPPAWAAIFLNNSSGNRIIGNTFARVLNADGNGRGQEHGIYLIHSSRNVVNANRFEYIGGDAVRFRHDSSNNELAGNVFFRAGNTAYVGDWFCRGWRVLPVQCSGYELPSFGNVLTGTVFKGVFEPRTRTGRLTYCHDVGIACLPERIAVR